MSDELYSKVLSEATE
ncbi:hypothetical protein [Haloarcula hispanica]|nr:hypothetical protein [Haloarcula hispanica]